MEDLDELRSLEKIFSDRMRSVISLDFITKQNFSDNEIVALKRVCSLQRENRAAVVDVDGEGGSCFFLNKAGISRHIDLLTCLTCREEINFGVIEIIFIKWLVEECSIDDMQELLVSLEEKRNL